MAKKKPKFVRPRRKLLIIAAAVILLGAVWLVVWLMHQHAVNVDRARFAQANKDVQTVAAQIVVAAGQPADRKDGGKCSYVHQEFGRGPLSCEVYSYLAYGVTSPDEVNAIVQKTLKVPALNGDPWKFKAITEKPYQFDGRGPGSDDFITLRGLFDAEIKSATYANSSGFSGCGVGYIYHNSLSEISGYPQLSSSASQVLLVDISCAKTSQAPYYSLQN